MIVPQALPTGTTVGDDFARELALLLGPAYTPAEGTLIAEDLHTLGDSLGDAYSTQQRALDEAFCETATELLDGWEFRLGLPTDASLSPALRRNAVTAKRRATGGGITARVLAAIQAIEGSATIRPNRCVDVAATNPRAIFQWVVVIPAVSWADEVKRTRILEIVRQMKPAHTRCVITTQVGFYADDPNSLTDRDVLRI
jgi:uncharacterized protein YmfQ (DUF2313 family)